MTVVDETRHESRAFDADVARLLHLIVHSVYSDKDVFLRELISNAADACEKLRYEAIAHPELLGDDPALRITLLIDAENKCLTVEDNGIGMSREEMVQGLGTIAHSGTKAFMDRFEAAQRAGRNTPCLRSFRGRDRSISSTSIARTASSFTSSGSSSRTRQRSCRAICVLFAGWSTRPTCRSICRAR